MNWDFDLVKKLENSPSKPTLESSPDSALAGDFLQLVVETSNDQQGGAS